MGSAMASRSDEDPFHIADLNCVRCWQPIYRTRTTALQLQVEGCRDINHRLYVCCSTLFLLFKQLCYERANFHSSPRSAAIELLQQLSCRAGASGIRKVTKRYIHYLFALPISDAYAGCRVVVVLWMLDQASSMVSMDPSIICLGQLGLNLSRISTTSTSRFL
jgi:hypothetical protein